MTTEPRSRAAPRLYRRILCATDGSECSRLAAAHARALAASLGAELIVLYVVAVDYRIGIHLAEEVREEEAEGVRACDEIVVAAQRDGVAARSVLVKGEPGQSIVDAVESEAADLVVLGRHGAGFLERVLLGSVADYVARHSKTAVLLVPPS